MIPTTRIPSLVALVLGSAGLCLALLVIPYQLDDAYIAYRYAGNLAEGAGPTFNRGGPAVEGFTSPAWCLLLAGIAAVTKTEFLPAAATVLGLTCFVLCLLAAYHSARPANGRSSPARDAWAAAVGVGLLASQPSMTFYAATGLETPLFLLAVLLFTGSAAGALAPRWGLAAGVLAIAIRPEGGWLAVVLGAYRIGAGQWRKLLHRETLSPLAALAAGGVAVLVVRLWVFGLPLPHTFYAKGSDALFGWGYVVDVLTASDTLGLVVLGAAGALAGKRRHRGYLMGALAWIPAVVLEGGDWMPKGRLLLPALGLLAMAAGGLGSALEATGSGAPAGPGRRRLAVLVAAGIAAAAALQIHGGLALSRKAASTETGIRYEARFVADWVTASGARSVCAVDIGLLGFRTGVEIVDLGGLTDPRIGRLPGTHLEKPVDPAYVLAERKPDVVVIRIERPPDRDERGRLLHYPMSGAERTLLAAPAFGRDYRLLAMIVPEDPARRPYYGKVLFARTGFEPRESAELPNSVIRLEPPSP